MIIGLSHITINSTDIEAARQQYFSNSWAEKLFERDVLNHPAKSIFLNKREELHHLSVLSKQGCNDIELVEHGAEKFAENNIYKITEGGVIEINCSNYDASLAFWRDDIGFREEGEVLVKASPLPRWGCKIKLIKMDQNPSSKLDNLGISCLAFYTTDIAEEIETLQSKRPLAISEDIALEINNRNLKINMLKGPSEELIELIELEH